MRRWHRERDAFGNISCSDHAFMSTSVDKHVYTAYMKPGASHVLWQLHCEAESTEGFHR